MRLGWPGRPCATCRPSCGAAGLDTLQQYFPYNVTLSATDLIEVIAFAMVMGVVLCGVTSFFTLRRYLRA